MTGLFRINQQCWEAYLERLFQGSQFTLPNLTQMEVINEDLKRFNAYAEYIDIEDDNSSSSTMRLVFPYDEDITAFLLELDT